MYTYTTIYPLLESWESSTGADQAFAPSKTQKKAKEYYWKIVIHQPGNLLPAGLEKIRIRYLFLNFLGFIFLAFLAYWFARASMAWGEKLGFDIHDLRRVNQTSINMLNELRDEFEDNKTKMLISGCLGPKDDGYAVNLKSSITEAKEYHLEQIATFKETQADLVSAYTMNYVEEAAGIALAAKSADMPVVISFTTETNGLLPSGQSLKEAIKQVESVSQNTLVII